jgi:hypothetical protein
MTFSQGFKASLRIGEETSYGVGPTPSTATAWKFPILPKPAMKGTQNLIASKALLDDPNPRKPVLGNRTASGSPEIEVSPLSIGWFLKWITGDTGNTVAAGTGSGYKVTGVHAVGVSTLAVDTGTGTIPVGSWVSIDGKMYRVAASTGGATVTTFDIEGGLVKATTAEDPVTVSANKSHKFHLVSTAQQSLFVEAAYSDVSSFELFTGVIASKMAFKFTPEGLMTVVVDLEGQQFHFNDASAIGGTITSPTHNPLSYFGSTIMIDDTVVGVVKSLDFAVDRAVDKSQYVISDSGTRAFIPSGIAVIDGTMKLLYTGNSYSKLADAGTEKTLRATVRQGTEALGLYLPEVLLEVSTGEIASEAVVEQTIPFKAYYSNSALSTAFEATLSNSQTNYTSAM